MLKIACHLPHGQTSPRIIIPHEVALKYSDYIQAGNTVKVKRTNAPDGSGEHDPNGDYIVFGVGRVASRPAQIVSTTGNQLLINPSKYDFRMPPFDMKFLTTPCTDFSFINDNYGYKCIAKIPNLVKIDNSLKYIGWKCQYEVGDLVSFGDTKKYIGMIIKIGEFTHIHRNDTSFWEFDSWHHQRILKQHNIDISGEILAQSYHGNKDYYQGFLLEIKYFIENKTTIVVNAEGIATLKNKYNDTVNLLDSWVSKWDWENERLNKIENKIIIVNTEGIATVEPSVSKNTVAVPSLIDSISPPVKNEPGRTPMVKFKPGDRVVMEDNGNGTVESIGDYVSSWKKVADPNGIDGEGFSVIVKLDNGKKCKTLDCWLEPEIIIPKCCVEVGDHIIRDGIRCIVTSVGEYGRWGDFSKGATKENSNDEGFKIWYERITDHVSKYTLDTRVVKIPIPYDSNGKQINVGDQIAINETFGTITNIGSKTVKWENILEQAKNTDLGNLEGLRVDFTNTNGEPAITLSNCVMKIDSIPEPCKFKVNDFLFLPISKIIGKITNVGYFQTWKTSGDYYGKQGFLIKYTDVRGKSWSTLDIWCEPLEFNTEVGELDLQPFQFSDATLNVDPEPNNVLDFQEHTKALWECSVTESIERHIKTLFPELLTKMSIVDLYDYFLEVEGPYIEDDIPSLEYFENAIKTYIVKNKMYGRNAWLYRDRVWDHAKYRTGACLRELTPTEDGWNISDNLGIITVELVSYQCLVSRIW